ncbi:MAG: hypothetical protein Fur005_08380 [Roseiflexaceae bacterium]
MHGIKPEAYCFHASFVGWVAKDCSEFSKTRSETEYLADHHEFYAIYCALGCYDLEYLVFLLANHPVDDLGGWFLGTNLYHPA